MSRPRKLGPLASKDLLWVGIQALLFAGVAAAALSTPLGPVLDIGLVPALVLIAAGGLVVLWTMRDLGKSLTPMPTPNGEGLVARGAYRHVRHPMYSALITICLGVAGGSGRIQAYLVVAALAIFFAAKVRAEERGLVNTYPGYLEYARQTGRFIPGLGHMK